MGRGPLVSLVDNAKPWHVTQHNRQGGERHGQKKKGARLFQNCAKRVALWIHVTSLSWKDVLTKRRPNHVGRRAQPALAGEQQRHKLRAITVSPVPRIQANQQPGERSIHKSSSLLSPALANRCRVASFVRRTRRPSPLMR